MDWQEGLRRLDDSMAANEITPAEYRKARDQILAEASSQPARPQGTAAAPPWKATQPIVNNQPQQRQQAARPAPVWSGIPASSPPYGEDVFAGARPRRRRSAWLLVPIVAVVLALVGGAVWWFAAGSEAEPTGPRALSIDMVPNPTGNPMSTSGVLTVEQAVTHQLIPANEAAEHTEHGVRRIFYRAVAEEDLIYQIYAYETATAGGGQAFASSLAQRARRSGMTDARVQAVPNVITMKSVAPDGAIYAAVYAAGPVAVRIAVSQTGKVDEATLTAALERAVSATVESIRPT